MNTKFYFLLILFFTIFLEINAQKQNHFVYGYVFDKETKEFLVGCNIYNPVNFEGTSTDSKGFYKLWISENTDSLKAQFLSYKLSAKKIKIDENRVDWYLEKQAFSVDEVVVSGQRKTNYQQDVSNFSINKQELKAMPALLGENDLLKFFQLSPGVQNTNDFNSELYVRGGSHDQNLYILDGIPLYHVSHVTGLVSTFNSDLINSSDLYKGSFPARFGGRLSSVLDIKTLSGDKQTTNYNLTLGLISSKLFLNGPVQKGKSSYLISLRKNTLPLMKLAGENNLGFSFFDTNLKFNTKPKKGNLDFIFYFGGDGMSYKVKDSEEIKTKFKVNWGNIASALQYNTQLSKRLFFDASGGISSFKYKETVSQVMYDEGELYSDINSKFLSNANNLFLKAKLNAFIFNKLEIVSGFDFSCQVFNPGNVKIDKYQNNALSSFSDSYLKQTSFLSSVYTEIILDDFYGFILNSGLRGNLYTVNTSSSLTLEPRINLSKKLGANLKIEAAYSEVNQFVHLLISEAGGIQLNYRFAADEIVKPSKSEQVVCGFSYISDFADFELTASAYYKSLSNLVRLREGVNFTNNFSLIDELIYQNGTGISKGIEFLFRKNTGNSSGWISATLSKTDRYFEDLNNNKRFPFKYDRRINVSALFQQKITERLNISFTWAYATGNPYTLPSAQFTDIDGNDVFIIDEINSFREKTYHRLDFGLQYKLKQRKGQGTINFSILNVYNHKNPYFLYTQYEKGVPTLRQQYQLPIFPSISYTYKFSK